VPSTDPYKQHVSKYYHYRYINEASKLCDKDGNKLTFSTMAGKDFSSINFKDNEMFGGLTTYGYLIILKVPYLLTMRSLCLGESEEAEDNINN